MASLAQARDGTMITIWYDTKISIHTFLCKLYIYILCIQIDDLQRPHSNVHWNDAGRSDIYSYILYIYINIYI